MRQQGAFARQGAEADTAAYPRSVRSQDVERRWLPIATWVVLTSAVITISHISSRVARDPAYAPQLDRGVAFFLDGLVQYDGHRYLAIASDGYWYQPGVQSSIAWFPLYPLLIEGFATFLQSPVAAAVVLTSTSSVIALCLYWTWLRRHRSAGTARVTAFLALALFPYAWYLYGVVYADALFLALVLAALLFAEGDRRWFAALAGALATATRPTGLILVPALLALAATQDGVLRPRPVSNEPSLTVESTPFRGVKTFIGRGIRWIGLPRFDRTAIRPRTWIPLLSLAGIGAYAAFLWWRFGDPLAFATNQSTFRGSYPILKLTFLSRMVDFFGEPVLGATLLLQFVLAVLALTTSGQVSRRFGFPYALLVLGSVAMPAISTHNFMGTGRYLLLAFPAWAVIGERLAGRRWQGSAVLLASGLTMLVMAWGFSRSVYLS